jgi:hypothetical protein
MFGNRRVDQLASQRPQPRERAFLVSAGQSAIPDHVSSQDRCKPTFDARSLHGPPPQGGASRALYHWCGPMPKSTAVTSPVDTGVQLNAEEAQAVEEVGDVGELPAETIQCFADHDGRTAGAPRLRLIHQAETIGNDLLDWAQARVFVLCRDGARKV